MIKWSTHQDIKIISVYEPISRASKYVMEKLMELKGETDKFKVKLKILTPSSLQLVNRATKKKSVSI